MNLIKESIRFAKTNPKFKYLLIIIIVMKFVIELISSELLVKISEGRIEMIPYLIITELFSTMVMQFVVSSLTTRISMSISAKFTKEEHDKYDSLDFDSKNKLPGDQFERKMNSAGSAYILMLEWGLPNFFNLVGSLVGSVWTFLRIGLLTQLVVVIIFNLILYYTYIKNKQAELLKASKKIREENGNIRSKYSLFFSGFQYKEYSPDYMTGLINKADGNNFDNRLKWINIMGVTDHVGLS